MYRGILIVDQYVLPSIWRATEGRVPNTDIKDDHVARLAFAGGRGQRSGRDAVGLLDVVFNSAMQGLAV